MPPKTSVTREKIVEAAVDFVRKNGADQLNARALAKALSCSTQPLFYQFESMQEIRQAVIVRAKEIYVCFLQREMKRTDEPAYKLSGLGYIRFAKEEKELFKLLFMRERETGAPPEEDEFTDRLVERIAQANGFSIETARRFHGCMWVFVHGFATMMATGYLYLDDKLISDEISRVYKGVMSVYRENGL